MSDITVKVEGLEEVNKALDEFSRRVQNRVVNDALRASARVFADAIYRNTPIRKTGIRTPKKFSGGTRLPGFLQRSVGFFKAKKGVPRGRIMWLAGPSEKGYYRHMVERGHIVGKRLRKGQSSSGRQRVEARPFIGPAFNSAYNSALNVFVTDMQIGVVDAAQRAGFRASKT